jgi:hypothetical protein
MPAVDTYAQDLWAVFIEARMGGKRVQWFWFPPSSAELGSKLESAEGHGRFIKRRTEKPGDVAAWKTTTKPSVGLAAHQLELELAQYETTNWTLMEPIVIPLELDDYQKAWAAAG